MPPHRAHLASSGWRTAAIVAAFAASLAPAARAQILQIPDPDPPSTFGKIASRAGATLAVAAGDSPIYQFDATTGALLRTLPIIATQLAPLGDDLIASRVSIGFPGRVTLFDSDTGATLRVIDDPAADLAGGFGSAVLVIEDDVLVSAPGSSQVYRFDSASGALLQTYPDPTPNDTGFPLQYGVSLAVVGGFVIVSDVDNDAVQVFDAASGTLLRTLTGGPGFGRAVESADDTIYVADSTGGAGSNKTDAIYRFDPVTGSLLQTLPNPIPESDFGFLPKAVGDRLFVGGTPPRLNDGAGQAIYVFGDDGRLVEMLRPFGVDLPDDGVVPAVHANLGTRLAIRSRAAINRADLIGPCGNAILDPGEDCDDGNVVDGDCCSATCTLDLSPCEAGASRKTTVSLRRLSVQSKDTLAFKWTSAAAFGGNLGDPLDGTDYALCVIEDVDGTPALAASSAAPATDACPQSDACWKASNSGALTLKSKTARPDGLTKVLLKPGDAGKGKIVVAGRGVLLGLPQRPLTPPVRVRVQRRDTGACWDASFDADIQLNTDELFKARAD